MGKHHCHPESGCQPNISTDKMFEVNLTVDPLLEQNKIILDPRIHGIQVLHTFQNQYNATNLCVSLPQIVLSLQFTEHSFAHTRTHTQKAHTHTHTHTQARTLAHAHAHITDILKHNQG